MPSPESLERFQISRLESTQQILRLLLVLIEILVSGSSLDSMTTSFLACLESALRLKEGS